MLLILKVTPYDYETFQKDFIECLIKNYDVGLINNIVVFYPNNNIVLPNNNKVKLVAKNGYTDQDIIDYCKRLYNDDTFIFSNPFVVFNNSLMHYEKNEKVVIRVEEDVFIFSRNYSDNIFNSTNTNPKIIIEKKQNWSNKFEVSTKIKTPIMNSKNIKKINSYLSKKVVKKESNIDVVIISVDYNDFLSITLEQTSSKFRTTVVTSSKDIECQKLCEKLGVKCVVTDKMYEDGASFNKGKAINEGIKSISNPEWILILDADIYLKDDIKEIIESYNLDTDSLYICKRLIINSHDEFIKWKNNYQVGNMDRAKGYGFFHLFYGRRFYSENYLDASGSDLEFRDKFRKKTEIDTYVVHLGSTFQNWSGRKTKQFISDFEINTYFDKIYCINLDSKKDRWRKVKRIFRDNSIEVERFSAISSDSINESDFNELLDKYNPYRLSGESASLNGLIENKNALGCLLSHLEIIKKAKENNYKRILIFEDDVILSEDFKEKIKSIINLDWSIVYLGASQFIWNGIEEKNGFYLCKNTLGTFAYAIESSSYNDVINLLETKRKSVDNLLSEIQAKNYGKCFTFYPNIVISNVEDSDIRESKNITNYSDLVKWNLSNFKISTKEKILLLPDVENWAFDNIAKSIVKYNPYPEKIEYSIKYARDIHFRKENIELDDWDLVFVMWEAERCIPDNDNVIRGCYSAFWLENSFFSQEKISEYFKSCRGGVFANTSLKDSICKFLPKEYQNVIIHDSTDEEKFYPISDLKEKKFTAIFVGNTERKVKNYEQIVQICQESNINLITCTNIDNSELVNYYNKADICINFSTFEGGPQTFLESSLCEVPMLIRSNNELSKLIPCFTGDSKEEFIKIINDLKNDRKKCKEVGIKARKAVLEDFTYKKTAVKFADFFLQSLSNEKSNISILEDTRKDYSKSLTVFIIRAGINPNYEDCLSSLLNQSIRFRLVEIQDIAPMSKAFQKMIDECKTDYYIQVDEDMILFEDTIEKIYHRLMDSEDIISTVAHMLNDTHLDFDIYGIKGYKHNILKNYPYNLEIISCEVEQMKRLQNDGFETLMYPEVVGYHSPKWNDQLIYERYFDLMEKWKIFKYDWLGELPAKLLEIFKSNPTEINLFALMGAMTSISNESPLRNREKNFLIKDKNFERIENLIFNKEFKFITKNNKPIGPEILNKNYVKK